MLKVYEITKISMWMDKILFLIHTFGSVILTSSVTLTAPYVSGKFRPQYLDYLE